MDDFAKFQPHQTADDKIVIAFFWPIVLHLLLYILRFRVPLIMLLHYPLNSDFLIELALFSWHVIRAQDYNAALNLRSTLTKDGKFSI